MANKKRTKAPEPEVEGELILHFQLYSDGHVDSRIQNHGLCELEILGMLDKMRHDILSGIGAANIEREQPVSVDSPEKAVEVMEAAGVPPEVAQMVVNKMEQHADKLIEDMRKEEEIRKRVKAK